MMVNSDDIDGEIAWECRFSTMWFGSSSFSVERPYVKVGKIAVTMVDLKKSQGNH